MSSALNQAVTDILRLLDAGEAREALARVDALLAEHPMVPGLYNIRAAARAVPDTPHPAVDDRRRAVLLFPAFHQALFNLANAARRSGQTAEALKLYDRVARIAPGFAGGHNSAGALLRDEGHWRKALARFRAATVPDPSHVDAHLNLANIQRDLGAYPAARASYRRALLLRPDHGTAWNHLGIATQEAADRAGAIGVQRRAVTIAPRDVEAHRLLANLKRYSTAGDPHLAMLQSLLDDPTHGLDDRARLHFALGKAHEDLGAIDAAFDHYRQGNASRKSALGYELSQHATLMDRVKRAFPTTLSPRLRTHPEPAVRPVFIVGMPRSGTTLIEQILAGHPDVHAAGELQDLSRLSYRYLPGTPEGGRTEYRSEDLAEIRRAYLDEIAKLAAGKAVVVDKMPGNFQWIGGIRAALPEARIINTDRDPRAVAWSLYRHYFPTAAHGYAYDLADIAGFHALYHDLMEFWARQSPGDILTLGYEAFTEAPEAGTRDLLAWCRLEWSDSCLDFHRAERPVKTASAAQVRRPVYRGSSDVWRRFAPNISAMLGGVDPLGFGDPGPIPTDQSVSDKTLS
jgi:tetratricopeptide (TPR) repeat protein